MSEIEEVVHWLTELSALSQQYQAVAAPIKARIKLLEAQLAQETETLTFAMETLEALIMPHILAAKQSQKVPYVTAVYVNRPKWASERLFTMAEEVPAILQAYEDGSTVQFRKTSHGVQFRRRCSLPGTMRALGASSPPRGCTSPNAAGHSGKSCPGRAVSLSHLQTWNGSTSAWAMSGSLKRISRPGRKHHEHTRA